MDQAAKHKTAQSNPTRKAPDNVTGKSFFKSCPFCPEIHTIDAPNIKLFGLTAHPIAAPAVCAARIRAGGSPVSSAQRDWIFEKRMLEAILLPVRMEPVKPTKGESSRYPFPNALEKPLARTYAIPLSLIVFDRISRSTTEHETVKAFFQV